MKYDNRYVTRTVTAYTLKCEVFNEKTDKIERVTVNVALPKWSNFDKSPATRFKVSREVCKEYGYKFIELIYYKYETHTYKMRLQDFINSDKIEIIENVENIEK